MEKMSELRWPQVLRCCVLGNTEAVTKELEVINADFVEEETGLTTLHLAAVSGCAELVNYLLEHGAAHIAGALDRQKKTPLHYAAAAGKMACVAALQGRLADQSKTLSKDEMLSMIRKPPMEARFFRVV